MASTPTRVSAFRGLNNVTDPVRLGLPWLTKADNINITSSGAAVRREGFALALAGTLTSVFATDDQERLYTIDAGQLCRIGDGMTATVLATGLESTPAQWAEFNEQVLFVCGQRAGIITEDGAVLPLRLPKPSTPSLSATTGALPAGQYSVCCTYLLNDGRETAAGEPATIQLPEASALMVSAIPQIPGAQTLVYLCPADSTVFQLIAPADGADMAWNSGPEALGPELTTQGLDPLPEGVECIAMWGGRLWASMFMQEQNTSVIWRSEPLAPHLFNLAGGFFMVNGHVRTLADGGAALIVGTDSSLHAYSAEGLAELASYGVVPGMPWAKDDKRLLIWTQRGLCQYPEFTNLTERRVSVAPGTHAASAVIEQDGQVRFVTALHAGGTPFNKRKEASQ